MPYGCARIRAHVKHVRLPNLPSQCHPYGFSPDQMDENDCPIEGLDYRLADGRVVQVLNVDRWRVRVLICPDPNPDVNYVTYLPREEFIHAEEV